MSTPSEQRLRTALIDLAQEEPFVPDLPAVERRGRLLRRRTWMIRGAVLSAVAVAAAGVTTLGSQTAPPAVPPAAASVAGPLTTLADTILTSQTTPGGDATLVLEKQVNASGEKYSRAGVFADNGAYYFSKTQAGVVDEIAAGRDQATGVFARAIDAARAAAGGEDLATARHNMAYSALEPGTSPPETPDSDTVDNWLWGSSYSALTSAGGNPQVRAGVLRILDSVKSVETKPSTTDGEPTLTLTSHAFGSFDSGKPGSDGGGTYQESLVINADTGVPLVFTSECDGETEVTIEYQVSRVTLAELAK